MDSTNNIPTTPNCGFESLIEDEEAACLVRRITLTSYDDLYRLVKASIVSRRPAQFGIGALR